MPAIFHRNQMDAIGRYADERKIQIVRTYLDEARSGLNIEGRNGLRDLIRDVEIGRADYTDVLVYDVSRWGDSRMWMKVPITSTSVNEPTFASTIALSSSRMTGACHQPCSRP